MKARKTLRQWPRELRERAEALLAGQPIDFHGLSPEQVGQLTHELQVHQIELEMQNEELRRAQAELTAARDSYADLYDYAPVAYVTTDIDGRIVAANLTAADLFGLERGQMIGTPLSDFVARQDQDAFYLHRRELLKYGFQRACELTLVNANGGGFVAQLDSTIAPAGDGDFHHFRTVITDVSERIRLDQALAQIRHRQSLEALAGGIAHDFNNLLTAVMGAHSLAMIDMATPDKLRTHFGVMSDGLEAIRDLVDELMTLVSTTASEKAATVIQDLVGTACTLATTGGNVECDYAGTRGAWPVMANERGVMRVLHNLVINAREAMPSGGALRITAANDVLLSGQVAGLPAGRYVRLSVADAGTGIPEADLPQVFDPYFSTKRRGQQRGTGLGLAVCHAIVTEHGGAITVESRVGAGTTFHVYLPAAAESAPARGKPQDVRRLVVGEGRILVMDDQEVVRVSACTMLARIGYTPVAACEGIEAVRIYREALESGERFAAVILDLTVPGGMAAKGAIREILAIDPEAIVLISSGYTQDPVVTEYAADGFRGALPKPYGIAELSQVLHTVLHGE